MKYLFKHPKENKYINLARVFMVELFEKDISYVLGSSKEMVPVIDIFHEDGNYESIQYDRFYEAHRDFNLLLKLIEEIESKNKKVTHYFHSDNE